VPIALLVLVVLPGVLPAVLEVDDRPLADPPAPRVVSRVESCGDAVLPALGGVVRSLDIDPVRVVLSEVSRDRSDWDTVPVASIR